MRHPTKQLSDVPLRPEPHVQKVIAKNILPAALPEKEERPTMRLNVDVDTDLYNSAIIKARRDGYKLSEVIRSLLAEYLSRN